MKTVILSTICLGILSMALPVQADEFGPRFQQEAPLALAENGYSLQSIEPASGEESTAGGPASQQEEIGGVYPSDQNKSIQNNKLPLIIEQ